MLYGGPAMAGLRPQREVEDEEDGPGRRGDKAAITEVPQRHTGHGGRASIALHYTAAERERERSHDDSTWAWENLRICAHTADESKKEAITGEVINKSITLIII